VGGSLTALKFDLDWIRATAETPAVQQRVLSALETVTHAIEASQRIMHNLRPAILEQGLVAALQWMASRFERAPASPASSAPATKALQLPAGVPLVAYRTAQEALTNVSKHAQARAVTIDLSLSAGVLSLEISDNGRGLRRPTWPRRAASASAACTSAPPPWAAGSTSAAAGRHHADPVGAARRAGVSSPLPTRRRGRPGP
jgi:signal transduction histidine kinase